MVKNSWSNPELKDISIEHTKEYNIISWTCIACNKEYKDHPGYCSNKVPSIFGGTRTCGSVVFVAKYDPSYDPGNGPGENPNS